jgi:polysaccharide biosynthesis protein PslH
VVDFCDVDSAKWTQYSTAQRWPSSAIFRREGERLLAYERSIAQMASASVFATRAEAKMFCRLAPEAAGGVHVVENGVDTSYFRPDSTRPTPFAADELPIVFTGAMDYWPNVDAVCWFASEVLPKILAQRPNVRFYVVGMNPTSAVEALARDPRVVVTGRVPDVRPYVQHARLVVAPLRVARGIQNKVLEAMAMERPVLVSSACAEGLTGRRGVDFGMADGADDFAENALSLLSDPGAEAMGRCARARILAERNWSATLSTFERLLDGGVNVPLPSRSIGALVEHAR